MFFLVTTCTPPVVGGAPAELSQPQQGQLKTSQWIDGMDPIRQTLWLCWGVVNCVWQNRKRLAEIDVICKVTILMAGYLTEAMLLAVWGERLKCLVRRRRLIAPCAAMVFVCKFNCDRGIWHNSVQFSMSFPSSYCFKVRDTNNQCHFFVVILSRAVLSFMESPLLRLTHDNFETNVERIFNQPRNDQTFSEIKLWRHCMY